MSNDDRSAQALPAVGSPVERVVRPYATSVTWRSDQGGSWQQWHDDDDPMPTEWDDRPPDEVVHVYTESQVAEMLAAERERCAKLCESISDDYQRREGMKYPELKTDAQDGAAECAVAIRRANDRDDNTSPMQPHSYGLL